MQLLTENRNTTLRHYSSNSMRTLTLRSPEECCRNDSKETAQTLSLAETRPGKRGTRPLSNSYDVRLPLQRVRVPLGNHSADPRHSFSKRHRGLLICKSFPKNMERSHRPSYLVASSISISEGVVTNAELQTYSTKLVGILPSSLKANGAPLPLLTRSPYLNRMTKKCCVVVFSDSWKLTNGRAPRSPTPPSLVGAPSDSLSPAAAREAGN